MLTLIYNPNVSLILYIERALTTSYSLSYFTKKLARVSTTSTSVTPNRKALRRENTSLRTFGNNPLQLTICICYPFQFAKVYSELFVECKTEVNAMRSAIAILFGNTTSVICST